MKTLLRSAKLKAGLLAFRATHPGGPDFHCPLCGYQGPFATKRILTGNRLHARCPGCHALERHRIQRLVMDGLFHRFDLSRARMLHFAPEHFFTRYFRDRVGTYETADLFASGVDHRADLRQLPFADASYDLVYASHVLEHIDEDLKAVAEIRRILRPGGLAVLPVPLVAEATIEYGEANPREEYHVRAPGPDYFDRYARHFSRVEVHRSSEFPDRHQTYVYEDRGRWPLPQCPRLRPMAGERHEDRVPVCFV